MRRSERRNNLQICPRRDSNTGGSDLWSNTRPLDHGGAPPPHTCYKNDNLTYSSLIHTYSDPCLINSFMFNNKIERFINNKRETYNLVSLHSEAILSVNYLLNSYLVFIHNIHIIWGFIILHIIWMALNGLWMAPASNGALLNIHYYYYYYYYYGCVDLNNYTTLLLLLLIYVFFSLWSLEMFKV